MKYYLVYLKDGIVTDITKYDFQAIRDNYAIKAYEMLLNENPDYLGFDDVQAVDIVD